MWSDSTNNSDICAFVTNDLETNNSSFHVKTWNFDNLYDI